jgi:hypothetical protein
VARARLRYGYADLLERTGDPDQAERWFDAVVRLDPEDTTDAADRLAAIRGIVIEYDDSEDEFEDDEDDDESDDSESDDDESDDSESDDESDDDEDSSEADAITSVNGEDSSEADAITAVNDAEGVAEAGETSEQ